MISISIKVCKSDLFACSTSRSRSRLAKTDLGHINTNKRKNRNKRWKKLYNKKASSHTNRYKTKLNAQMVVNNGRLSFFGWNKMPKNLAFVLHARKYIKSPLLADPRLPDWWPMNANLFAASRQNFHSDIRSGVKKSNLNTLLDDTHPKWMALFEEIFIYLCVWFFLFANFPWTRTASFLLDCVDSSLFLSVSLLKCHSVDGEYEEVILFYGQFSCWFFFCVCRR